MDESKNKSISYLVLNGEIGFVNSRNKIFKTVSIERVMKKYFDEIEEMAVKVI